ncbi:MAG: thioester reductase domain-containing protein [Acidimicrobiia bacterium]
MAEGSARLPKYVQRVVDMTATDPQLQQLESDERLFELAAEPGLELADIIDIHLGGYGDRPALGERDYDVVRDPSTGRHVRQFKPSFSTISFGELHRRVRAVAAAWQNHPIHHLGAGEFICELGFAGADYFTIDTAVAYVRAIGVPLQTTLAGADLDGIFTDTAPVAVATTIADLPVAVKYTISHDTIRSIIVFDYDERLDDDRETLAAARTRLAASRSAAELIDVEDLIAFGSQHTYVRPPSRPNADDEMTLLIHSSGSTGTPKGTIYVERTARNMWRVRPKKLIPTIRLCFAPLNHLLGRSQVQTTLTRGGTAYFTAMSDMSTLFEDFRLVRPTEVPVFPRVLEMVHRAFLGEVTQRMSSGVDEETARQQVMAEMRGHFLGDRIVMFQAGSAPTTPELADFIRECLDVTFVDGYGNTESGGGGLIFRNRINWDEVIEYKLRDVPELGYYTTDKPYPRGEFVVKAKHNSPGYFKKPEATAKLFDEDGFLCTGDILELRGPDELYYIDRRNDVLKLAQGEYVTCGLVGTRFEANSELIQQIYVYGNSARSYLVAVVVPNLDVARKMLDAEPTIESVRPLIRAELKSVGDTEKMRSFEIPRDFIVEFEPFTHENGLLSSVHKRMRPNLQRRYGEALEALYVELERRQESELLALHRDDSGLSVEDKVRKALESTLGLEASDTLGTYSFAELGGDSLGAAAFAGLLSSIFHVTVPVSSILSPAGNVPKWAETIEMLRSGKSRPTFASVHGSGARVLHVTDLDVTRFIDRGRAEYATQTPAPDITRTVLITGSTGFLGRFLLLEWLDRVAAVDGKVIALVRAASADSALDRLRAAFDTDPTLRARFDDLSHGHLEVLAGDVVDPMFGLSSVEYERLATEVDRIVHPAALVNHVLDYEFLFEPNVAGTAELIGLALHHRMKHFDFVSSIAATRFVDRSHGWGEDAPLLGTVRLSNDYGSGYGASKWAGEALLHSAHSQFGLTSTIFRGDMMLPHSTYVGQINVPDIFARLLFSLVITGLAPASFYEPGPDGGRARAHYDGVPVDFVATAIAGIGLLPRCGVDTFNMVNNHDDGVSMDSFVEWVESAGYPIDRVADHADWVRRFETVLQALPEDLRGASSYMVMDSMRALYRANPSTPGNMQFLEGLRQLPQPLELPHLTEAIIHKSLADLRHHGLLAASPV